MTQEEVLDGLKEVLTVLRPNTDLSNVNNSTELVRELGIDSLTMMLLSLAVEEKFKMRFPDGGPMPVTVGDVCENVLRAL
ncbi:MAG: acyl carrier protein [Bacteroidales bacterium]|nr:acyl carrier protein [Bacteroidales bacterium]MBR3097128.1 acyl carrier protein [Bacteroidales bacterium]